MELWRIGLVLGVGIVCSLCGTAEAGSGSGTGSGSPVSKTPQISSRVDAVRPTHGRYYYFPPNSNHNSNNHNQKLGGKPIQQQQQSGSAYAPVLYQSYPQIQKIVEPAKVYGISQPFPAQKPQTSYGPPQQQQQPQFFQQIKSYGVPEPLSNQIYVAQYPSQEVALTHVPSGQPAIIPAEHPVAQNYGTLQQVLQQLAQYEAPQQQQVAQVYGAPQQQQQQQQQQLRQAYGAPQKQQLSKTYKAPQAPPKSYGAPQQLLRSYGVPQQNYAASQSSVQAQGSPPQQKQQPVQSYGAPQQQAPPPSYGTSPPPTSAPRPQPPQAYGAPAAPARPTKQPSLEYEAPQGGYGGYSNTPTTPLPLPQVLPASQAGVFNAATPSAPMFYFSEKDRVLYKVSRLPINDNIGNELNSLAGQYGLSDSTDYIPVNIPQSVDPDPNPGLTDLPAVVQTTTAAPPAPVTAAPVTTVAGPGYNIEFEIEEETEGDPGTENQNPNLTPVTGGGNGQSAIPSGDGSGQGQATDQISRLALPPNLQQELEQLLRNPTVGPELQRQLTELVQNEERNSRARSRNAIQPSSDLPENLDAATGTPGQQQRRVRKRMNFKAGGAIG